MSGHVCYSVKKSCYNPEDSYGEICVWCNCCGRIDPATVNRCRLETNKQHLQDTINHDTTGYEDYRIKNHQSSIEYYEKRIAELEELIAKEAKP